MSAIVSIVGRPNVGKSTLFNRLVGKRRAIESDIPGTTRDRLYDNVSIEGFPVMIVDTGGLETKKGSDIEANVQEQSEAAIAGSDVIIFVVDVREELTAEDFHAATLLRKSKKTVILVANKCDNAKFEELRYNMFELGFGEPVALTALHSFGVDELESRVADELKKLGFEKGEVEAVDDKRIKIAFLGRPNVGKSTIVNALFGKKMVVVSEIAGTTRDSTAIPFEYKDTPFTLIDTAGIRRRGKVEPGLEKYSIIRSMQSVEQADICVLLIDATEGVTKQDCHVSEYVLEQRKGLILMVNKMDMYEGKEREDREHMLVHDLQNTMAYLPWAPVVFGSGLERRNIFPVLDLAMQITEERNRIVPVQDLRVWLSYAIKKHPPRGSRGKHKFNVLGVEQVDILPPTFVFYCDWPEIMHFSYGRFLENELRSQFGFTGTSLRMLFRKPGERGPKHKRKGALDADKPEEFTIVDEEEDLLSE